MTGQFKLCEPFSNHDNDLVILMILAFENLIKNIPIFNDEFESNFSVLQKSCAVSYFLSPDGAS